MVCFGLCKQFQRCKSRQAVWHTVVKPHRMLPCKRPKQDVIQPLIRLMQRGVYHKATSYVHYCLNSTLGPSILVVRSYAGNRLSLLFIDILLAIFFSRENSIITMIVFYFGISHIPNPLLKSCLVHYCLIGTK